MLPAKPGTAVLDVRTGGSWQATVISSNGEEIALTGRYDQVSEPDRLVMTVPGDAVTAITLTPAPDDTTQIAYAFDVDESMHTIVTQVSMTSSAGFPRSWPGSCRRAGHVRRHQRPRMFSEEACPCTTSSPYLGLLGLLPSPGQAADP